MRTLSRVICGVVGAVVVVASASSCVANDGSILIIGVLAPPTSTGTGGSSVCSYTANIIGPFLAFGTMDLGFELEYTPELLLGNQMVQQGNASLDRIETDNINIEGAIVRVTDSGGNTLDSYTVLGAGFLQPGSSGTPGLGTYATTLVSPTASAKLGTFTGTKRLVSYVKVYGTTSGGTHVESGEVPFSINACYGCLVQFSSAADDPAAAKQPNCDATSSSGGSPISAPCIFGQDQPIDCRLCVLTNPGLCEP